MSIKFNEMMLKVRILAPSGVKMPLFQQRWAEIAQHGLKLALTAVAQAVAHFVKPAAVVEDRKMRQFVAHHIPHEVLGIEH